MTLSNKGKLYYLILLMLLYKPFLFAQSVINFGNGNPQTDKRAFNSINFKDNLNDVMDIAVSEAVSQEFNFQRKNLKNDELDKLDNTTVSELVKTVLKNVLRKDKIRLSLKEIYTDIAGNKHFIFYQYINEVQVDGAIIVAHFTKDWQLIDVSGAINSGGNLLSTVPVIDGVDALTTGLKKFKENSSILEKPTLRISGNKLAWRFMLKEPDNFESWEVVVDAKNDTLMSMNPMTQYYSPPGYPSNGQIATVIGNLLDNEGGTLVNVNSWKDNSTSPSRYYLFNNNEHWQVNQNVITNNYYQPVSNWQKILLNQKAISLAYNISKVQQFVRDSLNRNSYDGKGIMAICSFDKPDASGSTKIAGSWDGSQINICPESSDLYPPGVLDVTAHEFGHALTQFSSHLDYTNGTEPAILNESYSDILGHCVEFFVQPDGRSTGGLSGYSDWYHSEDAVKLGSISRSADVLLYKSSNYNGADRYNSLVPGCFRLIAEGVTVECGNNGHQYGPFKGLGVGLACKIAWGAQFNGKITQFSTLFDARNAWIYTAKTLSSYDWIKPDAGIVAQAWTAVGVVNRVVGSPAPGETPLPGLTNTKYYSRIQDAVNEASNGELIYVYPGVYQESFTINKPYLTLVSRNRDLTTIRGTVTLGSAADFTTITGFTIDGGTTADGISLSGTSSDYVEWATISTCKFQNCRNGIMMNYARYDDINGNQFLTGSTACINQLNSNQNGFFDNRINGIGVVIGNNCNTNQFYQNRFDYTSGAGINISGSNTGAIDIAWNEFMNIIGSDITSNYSGVYLNYNIFTNPGTFDLLLPSGSQGYMSWNSFKSAGYNISVPSNFPVSTNGNYWNDYKGICTDGDGIGETNLPHHNVEYYPLLTPKSTSFCIKRNNEIQLGSVCLPVKSAEQWRVKGSIYDTTSANCEGYFPPPPGLTIKKIQGGNAYPVAIISNSGDLVNYAQPGGGIYDFSSKYLSVPTNLSSGLAIKDHQGKTQMLFTNTVGSTLCIPMTYNKIFTYAGIIPKF